MLFAADLHYTLKQLDWLVANAGKYDLVIIGGDLLDLGSALDSDVQIVVVEKYLRRIHRNAPLLVSSGNHDGDSRNAADESVAEWLLLSRADGLYVDGESAVLEGTRVTACPWWDGPKRRTSSLSMSSRMEGMRPLSSDTRFSFARKRESEEFAEKSGFTTEPPCGVAATKSSSSCSSSSSSSEQPEFNPAKKCWFVLWLCLPNCSCASILTNTGCARTHQA
jgi:hypothetical protein